MGLSRPNRRRVFDEIRNDWVAATGEELVRQAFLQKMVGSLGFPKHLLAVEKDLRSLPHLMGEEGILPERRADIICFAKDIHPEYSLYPLLIVECKDRALDQKALEQLLGYNAHVKAYFVALVSQDEVQFGYFEKALGNYRFVPFLPSYAQLIDRIKHG